MCTIQTYTLLESEPQIRKNSLAHRSWDSGHFLANVVLVLGNCRWLMGINAALEVPPEKKIQWREIWLLRRPRNVLSTGTQFSSKHFVYNS